MVDYYAYLNSPEWKLTRRQVIDRAEGICERCRASGVHEIHHISYLHLGFEPLEELQGLCQPCHEFIHGKASIDPMDNDYSRRMRDAYSQGGDVWRESSMWITV